MVIPTVVKIILYILTGSAALVFGLGIDNVKYLFESYDIEDMVDRLKEIFSGKEQL